MARRVHPDFDVPDPSDIKKELEEEVGYIDARAHALVHLHLCM